MPIINGKDVRFLALPYSLESIAIGKELMVDYNNGTVYVKSKDGKRNIQLGRYSLIEKSTERFDEITKDVSEEYNTLKKMEGILSKFVEWKKEITKDTDVDNVVNILNDLFGLYDEYGGNLKLKDLLDLKEDKVEGKQLSTNDFTNELLEKLKGIEEEANNYKHPVTQVCNYKIKIKKINNQSGRVILNKETLGLGQVPDVVKVYRHPQTRQCTKTKVVYSLYQYTYSNILSKAQIGLPHVADFVDYHNNSNTDDDNKGSLWGAQPAIITRYMSGSRRSFVEFIQQYVIPKLRIMAKETISSYDRQKLGRHTKLLPLVEYINNN